MAASTPATSVTPQIFTVTRRATLAGSVGAAPGSHERPNRGCRVRRPDERFADERAIEAERPPAGDDRGVPDAGFSDHEAIVGDELAQAAGAFDIDLERPEVAVVEPDESSVRRERPIELTCVVDLHERLKAELERRVDETTELLPRMEDGQEEDKVRSGRSEHPELDLLDDEVLGKDGYGDRRADRPEVVDRAAEPVRFAQDRDRRCTTGLVRTRPGDDVLVSGGDLPG